MKESHSLTRRVSDLGEQLGGVLTAQRNEFLATKLGVSRALIGTVWTLQNLYFFQRAPWPDSNGYCSI